MTSIVFAILLINITIYIFYRFFETGWPTSYFTENDKTGLIISVTPLRFFIFRILPVFLISFLFLRIFKISDISSNIGLVGIMSTLLHLMTTNFIAVYKLFSRDSSIKSYFNKTNQFLYHFITITCIILVGYLAGICSKNNFFDQYLPTQQGLIDNVWSSIIYTVFFIGFWKFYVSQKEKSIESILERSISQIRKNNKITDAIKKFSLLNQAKPEFIEAICVVENIQRPKWFRRIEQFLPNSSYGIMQIHSKSKISDEESIKLASSKFLQQTDNISHIEELETILYSYNNSSDFVELVEKALELINGSLYYELIKATNH